MADTPGFNDNEVGADMEIEFCLAQRDPNGMATSGITRHYYENNSMFGWEMNNIEEIIKPQTQWDPTKYLNIWVVSSIYIDYMGVPAGELAGYSQFPTQSGLDGLEEPGLAQLAETDGVTLGAAYCGSSDIYPEGFYIEESGKDKGRSASHEVGHFFGLRHIWGDGGCDIDDYCEDTPVAAAPNSGCPEGQDSCPNSLGLDMIQNYMDYTNDSCMNVFTQDQKERMQAVLANSPRRVSLITSNACQPGVTYDLDGSLNILKLNRQCDGSMIPVLALHNNGNNEITSASISYEVSGYEELTFEWTGNLSAGETAEITLDELKPAIGDYTFTATLANVNEINDEFETNNITDADFTVLNTPSFETNEVTITINTDNNGAQTSWALIEGSNITTDSEPLASGGNYPDEYDNNTTYNTTVEVESGKCYTFIILDFGGNGLTGNGSYSITDADGNLITEGADFAIIETKSFGVDLTFDYEDFEASLQKIILSPNPVNNILTVTMPGNDLPDNYTIFNNIGQIVAKAQVNSASALNINTSAYSNGIYFIKIEKGGQSTTLKFIKN